MRDLRTQLQEGDPLVRETDLSRSDADHMRRHIVSTLVKPAPGRRGRFVGLVAALLVVSGAAAVLLRRPPPPQPAATSATLISPAGREALGTRQLQFSAPGGTRVIWMFSPDFPLR